MRAAVLSLLRNHIKIHALSFLIDKLIQWILVGNWGLKLADIPDPNTVVYVDFLSFRKVKNFEIDRDRDTHTHT